MRRRLVFRFMVTKEEVLAFMDKSAYRPLTEGELVVAFGIPATQLRRFRRLLKELETEGDIYVTRAARYGLPARMNLVVGRLQGHAKGFGFVIPKQPGEPDVFVGAANMNGAMHNDNVVVRVVPGRNGKREGEVVKILHHANERVVGTFQRQGHHAFVVCDEARLPHDILIPRGRHNGAKNGDKVVAAVTAWPGPKRGPEGKVMEVLGPADAPGMDILALCRRYGLPEDFPRKAAAEAEAIPETIGDDELVGRRDLRDWTIVTIDGEDAKDLDDGVSLEAVGPDRRRLGVHIADVSYYVREGGPLDREAAKRGTSFYLPGMVIPMLPPRLSNGICSLNPRADRLAMSVVMDIDGRGEVVAYEVFPSVIRTTERMTYTSVRKILRDEDPAVSERYADLVETFRLMERLALTLRERRFRQGAIDFNLPEAKVKLNELGHPVELCRAERSMAEQIIEEFMLVTNEVVARHFRSLGVPFVYRVHERPDPEKLQNLQDLLQTLGYGVRGFPDVKPGALQRVLDQVAGKKEEQLVNAVTLRSMKQAHYATEQLGHFGLASSDYTHFTSPIRRYPDLLIHRIIREVLQGGLTSKRTAVLKTRLPDLARYASEQERRAVEAEREAMDIKKAAYMEDKVGQTFPGIISGVTPFGMFVELENTVEGLLGMADLTDDYYTYEEKKYRLVGQRTGKIYRLGDAVDVRVLRASAESRQVDFTLAE